MCPEWIESFEAFFKDMGVRPEGKTIDRINSDGPYAPWNCRWADKWEQAANTRQSKKIMWNGEMKSLRQVAEINNVCRLQLGDLLKEMPLLEAIEKCTYKFKDYQK